MSSPAKRVEDMTPEERLRSLQDFAEEKKYVRPGEAGTLPYNSPGGMQALEFGCPMRNTDPGYDGILPPPSYDSATGQPAEKKKGPVKRWLEKRREKKQKEGGHGEAVVR